MSKEVIEAYPTDRLVHARRKMLDNNVGRLPVVDEDKLVGMITSKDLMRAFIDFRKNVPEKYQNPRTFPNRGKNIAELSVGIVLTDLLITAPVGIPMIVHATTKMKNQSWYEKKQICEWL